MRLNVAVPEPYVTAPVLDAALEGVTRLNEQLLEQGAAPLFTEQHHVRWKPEPPGQEHFDHAGIVMGRGWGDCDDLAPWHAAGLRVTGEDPEARAIVKRSGPKRWHAVVQRSDGSIDDPSLAAGMPGRGRGVGVNGAALPVMFARPKVSGVDGTYIARPQLALRPIPDEHGQPEAWEARTDLPWHWQPGEGPGDVAMVSLHASPVTDQALVGSLVGAYRLGAASGFANDDDLDRICCLEDMLEGADWRECAEEWGPEHATAASNIVGSFFGGLKKLARKAVSPAGMMSWTTDAASKLYNRGGPAAVREFVPPSARPMAAAALPIAQQVAPFIPGWGPAAAMALQFASPMLQRSLQSGAYMPPQGMAPGFGGGGMPGAPMPFGGGFGGGMPFGMSFG